MAKQSKGFDISLYQVDLKEKIVPITIEDTGDTFEITMKDLGWSKKLQLVSSCMIFEDSGRSRFDGNRYVKECLKEMIIEAPWGKTTEAFLLTIDERLGTALELLVPGAFDDGTTKKASEIKKE